MKLISAHILHLSLTSAINGLQSRQRCNRQPFKNKSYTQLNRGKKSKKSRRGL